MSLIPVILSGGSGTRLWPLSREGQPKQFLRLCGTHSMLQQTWLRAAGLCADAAPLVVASEQHRFIVAEQLLEVSCTPAALILEPVARNTAPAIAAAAFHAMARGGDPLLLVLPSDHCVADESGFHAAVRKAAPAAAEGALVTFGIVPATAQTGYGYIKAAPGEGVRAVECFVEKPGQGTAESYLASGRYLWNSGMFLFRASRYLQELKRFNPDMYGACERAVAAASVNNGFLSLDAQAFAASPSDSIDYAVMEKTDAARVLPVDVGWNDVGSWSALWELSERDASGNACRGDVLSLDCRDSFAWSERRLVAMIGLQDTVVVDTDDALLVARRDQVQRVKDVVGQLKGTARGEAVLHRKVQRPMGGL